MAVTTVSNGDIYFATSKAINKLKPNGVWEVYSYPSEHLGYMAHVNTYLADFSVGLDGSVWIVSYDLGLMRLKTDGSWTSYIRETGNWRNNITCLDVALDGSVWIGNWENGVSQFRP